MFLCEHSCFLYLSQLVQFNHFPFQFLSSIFILPVKNIYSKDPLITYHWFHCFCVTSVFFFFFSKYNGSNLGFRNPRVSCTELQDSFAKCFLEYQFFSDQCNGEGYHVWHYSTQIDLLIADMQPSFR